MSPSEIVEHFLLTGEVDPTWPAWEGDLTERRCQGQALLRTVLAKVVRWRSRRAPLRPQRAPADAAERIRARVGPMLRGLLAPDQADALLACLPARVEVITVGRFVEGLDVLDLDDLYALANLLLDDLGAPPLSDEAPQLDGFCAAGRAWVLPRTLLSPPATSDVLVHECAHLLHEPGAGLVDGGGALVPIDEEQTETFAYACERWACVLRAAGTEGEAPDALAAALAELRSWGPVTDPRVDRPRLTALLDRAVQEPAHAWRIFAEGCAPAVRMAAG